MSYSTRIKPISYLKANAAEVIRELSERRVPLVIEAADGVRGWALLTSNALRNRAPTRKARTEPKSEAVRRSG